MLIDFTPVRNNEIRLADFAPRFTIENLRDGANAMIDTLLDMVRQVNDEQIAFIPDDPDAWDEYAPPEEQKLGWSMAHLIVHTTASMEEGAALSSILARGIAYTREPRLRYETPWREITTQAQAIQRLEESRRMINGYLDAWPDVPHLDVHRDVSPRYIEKNGPQNATAAFLYGLMHQDGHLPQFREVLRQALQANQAVPGE